MSVTSTNFITSTVMADDSGTATVTRYVTVTTYDKRFIGSSPIATVAELELGWPGILRQDAPATGISKRDTMFTTTTETTTQIAESTVSITDVIYQKTTEIETVDVVVTSVIYPSASNTVTIYATVTATSSPFSVGATTIASITALIPSEATSIATAAAPATSISTPTAAADGEDLSASARAGIGAGVGGFVLLVAMTLAIVILRKRRRSGVYPLVLQPSAMAQQHPRNATAAHSEL